MNSIYSSSFFKMSVAISLAFRLPTFPNSDATLDHLPELLLDPRLEIRFDLIHLGELSGPAAKTSKLFSGIPGVHRRLLLLGVLAA